MSSISVTSLSSSRSTPSVPHQIRALTQADVADVLRIQARCYGAELVEGAAVFQRRLQDGQHCSWAAEQGGQVVAYLAAYWSHPGKVTPLQGDFSTLPEANVLYLHDMAVEPALAGQGIAAQLLDTAISDAQQRGIWQAALVAVQGAASYWQRRGFVPSAPANAAQQAQLQSYGDDAYYMVRCLLATAETAQS